MAVFVPTTPNPTSGFVLTLPKSDVTELEMTREQALQMIISLGVVVPDRSAGKTDDPRRDHPSLFPAAGNAANGSPNPPPDPPRDTDEDGAADRRT